MLLATLPVTLNRLARGWPGYLRSCGARVTAVASPGADLVQLAHREAIQTIGVSIARDIAPLQDLRTLHTLTRLMGRERPDIVTAGTPKAAWLGLLAAAAAGVPERVYLVRGLRWETTSGLLRQALLVTERMTVAAATSIVAVSPSVQAVLANATGLSPRVIRVLGSGSSNGVDLDAFCLTAARSEQGQVWRHRLGIPATAPVVGFVGQGLASPAPSMGYRGARNADMHRRGAASPGVRGLRAGWRTSGQ